MGNSKRSLAALLILLSAIIYFPIFLHLDAIPVRLWDESRMAANAIEMLDNGLWVVTHYEGKPDLWNTKPPLMIWLQVISLKLFGISELAIRLPAALAAVATCLLLFFFSRRFLNATLAGFFSAIVLVTSVGYISIHSTRTGDYDSLLALLTLGAALTYFAWTEYGSNKYLLWFFIILGLGVLTKGIAGMMFLPGLAIYTIIRKKLLLVFKTPATYAGLAIFLLMVFGYYFYRESLSPGYLTAVYENELGGRFLVVLEKHYEPWWFYLKGLTQRYIFWLPFIILSWLALPLIKEEIHRRIIIYLSLVSACFLLVISISQTKIVWYDVPLYVLLALPVGLTLYHLFMLVWDQYLKAAGSGGKAAFIAGMVFFFALPYINIISTVYRPWVGDTNDVDEITHYLKRNIDKRTLPPYTYLVTYSYGHPRFYVRMAKEKGIDFSEKTLDEIVPGDRIVTNDHNIEREVEGRFKTALVKRQSLLSVYDIIEPLTASNDSVILQP